MTYTNLRSVVGPKSNLYLKRNNWFKAIQDAILQIKNNYAKNHTVAANDSESNSNNGIPTVATANRPHAYPANNNLIVSRVHRPLGDE